MTPLDLPQPHLLDSTRVDRANLSPFPHPLRLCNSVGALVAAVEQSFATRFPKRSRRGLVYSWPGSGLVVGWVVS